MFNRMHADVIKTLLIPPLEILASRDYQERFWLNNSELAVPYWEIIENFLEISRTLLSPGEEYQLDEKNRGFLKDLYEMIDNFFTYKMLSGNDDIQSFINNPDWLKIQGKAKELTDVLHPIVRARQRDVIEFDLVPSLEELANQTYQENNWTLPEGKSNYSNWFRNFTELCDFLLLPSEETLNQKNKQHLNDLYKKVDEFDDKWGEVLRRNPSSLIKHADWIKIQYYAADFIEILKNR